MSSQAPLTFLYAEAANPSLGEVALLPGFRPHYTNRGLPDLIPDPNRCVPGIIWEGVPPPPEAPFKGDQATAVLVKPGRFEAVVPVLIRRQRKGGFSTSANRELMEAVRLASEACGFPYAWVTEGLAIEAIDSNFGKAVGVRVRSVADRISRGQR